MTIWVLISALPEVSKGEALLELPLLLPIDVTDAVSFPELRARLKPLDPHAPPEQLNRSAERVWRYTHGVGREDIVALPLPDHAIAFAEVIAPVRYADGRYALPVRVFPQRASLRRFRRHAALFNSEGEALREVQDAQARSLIRDCLPLSGNRFRRLKWLLIVIAVMQFGFFALHFWQRLIQRNM